MIVTLPINPASRFAELLRLADDVGSSYERFPVRHALHRSGIRVTSNFDAFHSALKSNTHVIYTSRDHTR